MFLKNRRTLGVLFVVVWILISLSMQAGAINWFIPDSDDETTDDSSATSQEYTTVASNDVLELQMTDGTGRMRVRMKETGHIWRSWQKDELSTEEVNTFTYLQSNVESAFMCTYISKDNQDSSYQTVYADECSRLSIAPQNNGADVTYGFEDLEIELTIQYRVENNTLRVSIPKENIKENGEYLLATISLAPFLGSGRDTDEGFVLLPDGSGTLIRFKEDHPKYTSCYEQSIYGSDTVRVEQDICVSVDILAKCTGL